MSDSPEAQQLEARQSTAGPAQQSSDAPSTSASSIAAAAASIAPWREAQGAQAGSHALRIASNPNLPGPAPLFVKQPMQQLAEASDQASSDDRNTSAQNNRAASASSNMPQLQAEGEHRATDRDAAKGKRKQAPRKQHQNRPPRLQHDDPFLAYDVVVA